MRRFLVFASLAASLVVARLPAASIVAVTDGTNYNVGSIVGLRVVSGSTARLSATIRYAGEERAIARDVAVDAKSDSFSPLWTIPRNAQTGRYEVDLNGERKVASFAVHRKSARIARVELDRTFYTKGDPINCRVVVRNLLDHPLEGIRVEFGPFYYPWIAPAPDEPKIRTTVLADSLNVPAGGERELSRTGVAVAWASSHTEVTSYSIVIWDHAREHVLDLAFTPPTFSRPVEGDSPKQYPFLYLYPRLTELAKKAFAYRDFYPPQFLSNVIEFDTAHTLFRSGDSPAFSFRIKAPPTVSLTGAMLRTRVLDASDKEIVRQDDVPINGDGLQHTTLKPLPVGRYVYEVALVTTNGTPVATNRLEFALDQLPKSILIFCAHQDDETAHPALIRAAIENHIPIHIVYFTSGDAGGCDRFYMNPCDAARAMDFGETRMEEARASLGHLGVSPNDISFLGLPDGGMEEIWLNHPSPDHPYLSVLLASDHAPYRNLVKPNLAFAREPVIEVVKDFIRRYQPDVIVTGHPEERHVDHRTNNWMVVKAMQSLRREGRISQDTRLLVDQSYGATSWIHSPYKYQPYVFYVPGEVAKLGQEALWFYQSQDGNHQQAALVRYQNLPRGEAYPHVWLLDWQQHEGWNEHKLTGGIKGAGEKRPY